jgi:hypothetical protein
LIFFFRQTFGYPSSPSLRLSFKRGKYLGIVNSAANMAAFPN